MESGEGKGESEREKSFRALSEEASDGTIRELWALMRHNRKWWMIPALVVLLVTGLLLLLAGSGAAPFIYTLF